MAQYTKLPEAAVQATSFPTFRLSRMISKCLRPLEDVDQLDSEVDRSKLVVTPWNTRLVVIPKNK
jgi:hypothetical protein